MKCTTQSDDPSPRQSGDGGEDAVIGCLPRMLLTSHREVIENIVGSLPDVVAQGKSDVLDNDFDRYARLLDIYQEQPNLLDCVIPLLLKTLESYITLPSSANSDKSLNHLSITALRYISHLMKVRGFKVIIRLLPHHVSYLDKLLSALEQYQGDVSSDLYERHTLLLWLWVVCKNPFDFKRFDPVNKPGSTSNRILKVATSYLKYPWATTHPAAVLVIAQCLARHDGIPLISDIVSECVDHISRDSECILGYTMLICAILKHVDRQHLLVHVSTIRESVAPHFPLETSKKDTLTRKMFIKLVQRLALVTLRPKVAVWRYRRGRRRLEEILKRHSGGEPSDRSMESIQNHTNGDEKSSAWYDDEDDGQPDDTVEWVVGCLLRALSDDHTTVRWSASKGVGRITSRLSKEFAIQVVDSILSSNFHSLAGHSSWHGGCLALAELSRRGALQPEALDKVFPTIQQALFYEEPMGGHAFGSNVRDAACYVLWAFARAYEPHDLRNYIEAVAKSLVCVALFDREVNLRRAASAAFQENVGRQSNIPNGIYLLTIADYIAVGNRSRCYTKLCVEVVGFPEYADAVIDHLIDKKVNHWDEVIRKQAAVALGLLAPLHSSYLSSKLEVLLDGCTSSNPIHRHGFLLALSHSLQGLLSAGCFCNETILHQAIAMPRKLRLELEKPKISGGELTRLALAEFMCCLAAVPVALDNNDITVWQERLLILACDDTAVVRSAASAAASNFFPAYFSGNGLIGVSDTIGRIAKKIENAQRENERIGLCSVVAFIPPHLINAQLFEAVCNVILKQSDVDDKWALARRSAVDALGAIFTGQPYDASAPLVFDVLFRAAEDYTTDCHGDIGRLVRMSAMCVMTKVLCYPEIKEAIIVKYIQRVVQSIIQQSVSKIGRIRETACKCIKSLLSVNAIRAHIAHADELSKIYRNEYDFIQDTVFLSVAPLLSRDEYYHDLICGLILSAGGVSEGTTLRASQALMAYQLSISKDMMLMERFLYSVAELFDVGRKIPRIGNSVLRFLPQILSRLYIVEHCPDRSNALSRIIVMLTKIINSRSMSPIRIKCALNSLCSLLGCNRKSKIWYTAVQLVVRSLSNPLPVVRRAAAEGLYENICLFDVDEQVLMLLTNTLWHETSPSAMESIREAAQTIESILLE
ncbi:hypothetical protein KIN20_035536 [Parelaphostrongylus tenuis]|uniref:Tubulin-specific chaperone D n=1 Tax=Parelaphostrongylus tenuis TaxID=148309 RepID=A0AAD5WKL4_PARTN|nr:hypothetical protein KIN20_035536 [Parelaphostrongylus tenuis]